jgi:RND superfamily putative drug exporter
MTRQDPHPSSALGRLADVAFRRRGRVLVAWLAVLATAIALGAVASGSLSADYATPGSSSERAERLLESRFENRSQDTVDLVWTASQGAGDPAVRRSVDGVLAKVGRLEGLTGSPSTRQADISPDGSVGVVRIALDRRPDLVPETTGVALREAAESAPDGVTMAVAGGWVNGVTEEGSASSEMIGLAVAAVVLLLTFGTLTAAGLPLMTALFGLGVSASLIGVLAAVVDTPDWAPQVGAMMGIGVGIDYALLLLTRFRAATGRGRSPHAAAIEAGETAGRSVLVAGATVVVSLAGLFLMGLPYLYGVALAASLSVLVVMAAALTLLPAMLGFLGHRIERLRIPGTGSRTAEGGRVAAAWARVVQRRPAPAAILATVALLAMALPVTGLRIGFPDAGNDREDTTTRQAYDLLAQGFGPGANGPLVVIAQTPDAGDGAAVTRLAADIADEPGVAAVSPVQRNAAGDTALVAVTPETAPQDAATEDLVHALRDGPLARAPVQADLGGATAAQVDQGEATLERLPLFVGGVVGLSFLLLLLAFRAPLVALKAGVMNLLSIGAAYGVVALIADGGWAGQLVGIDTPTPVPPFIPVMMFAVLFGLSMDYEVFLLSRVREELARRGSTSAAVAAAIGSTARVITAAAAIMVAVFAAFALAPEVFLKLIGIGLATAILVDATIVRMVLAPAVMQLLGERNWWIPRWLDRALPRVALERPEPAAA